MKVHLSRLGYLNLRNAIQSSAHAPLQDAPSPAIESHLLCGNSIRPCRKSTVEEMWPTPTLPPPFRLMRTSMLACHCFYCTERRLLAMLNRDSSHGRSVEHPVLTRSKSKYVRRRVRTIAETKNQDNVIRLLQLRVLSKESV